MAKRKRRPYTVMRFRKGDPVHNLMAAAQHWLISHGSYPVVVGGIGIIDQENAFVPGSSHKFQVCVGMIGEKPVKPEQEDRS